MSIIKAKGVTLLELLLVIGIMTTIMVTQMESKLLESEQIAARSLGNELFEYTNGVRGYISDNYPQLVSTDIPGAGGSLTLTGTDWLKDSSCAGGTGAQKYVTCGIGNNTGFGNHQFSITLTQSGGMVTGTHDLGPVTIQGDVRQDLASIAALTAAGNALNNGTSSIGVGATFLTDARLGIPAASRLAPFGFIRYTVDQNSVSDIWLRTDGGNEMDADLAFNPGNTAVNRGIVNLARIANTNSSGANDQIAFESAIDLSGAALGNRQIENIETLSNAAGGSVEINDDFDVTGNSAMSGTLDVNGNITAPLLVDSANSSYFVDPAGTSQLNTANATGRISSGIGVIAPIFVDSNNAAYYFNPASTSNVNTLNSVQVTASAGIYTPRLYDSNNTAYYIDPASTSMMNNVNSVNTYTSIMYDRDDTSYYIDPASTSRMDYVDMNVARLSNNYSVDGACTTKMIGTTSSGDLLTCVGGFWKKSGGSIAGLGLRGVYMPFAGRGLSCTHSSKTWRVRVLSDGTPQVYDAYTGAWSNGTYFVRTRSSITYGVSITTQGMSSSSSNSRTGARANCSAYWTL